MLASLLTIPPNSRLHVEYVLSKRCVESTSVSTSVLQPLDDVYSQHSFGSDGAVLRRYHFAVTMAGELPEGEEVCSPDALAARVRVHSGEQRRRHRPARRRARGARVLTSTLMRKKQSRFLCDFYSSPYVGAVSQFLLPLGNSKLNQCLGFYFSISKDQTLSLYTLTVRDLLDTVLTYCAVPPRFVNTLMTSPMWQWVWCNGQCAPAPLRHPFFARWCCFFTCIFSILVVVLLYAADVLVTVCLSVFLSDSLQRSYKLPGLVQAWVGQIVTFFETAALAAPWAP